MSPNTELGKIVKRHQRANNIWMAAISLLAAVGLTLGLTNKSGLEHSVQTSCQVQARNLEAAPYQQGIYREIDGLLSPVPGQPHPVLPRVTFDHVFNLRWDLDHYLKIVKNQPKSRDC